MDSAVIVLEPFIGDDADLLGPDDEDGLWRLVQAAFRERRKMIHNVLSRQLPIDAAHVDAGIRARIDRPGPAAADAGRRRVARAAQAMGPIGPDARGRRAERAARVGADDARHPGDDGG